MALQYCVKCGELEMTWAIDEEVSEFTFWFCTHCNEVVAWEDERRERGCTDCKSEKGQSFMWTEEEAFWLCFGCNKKIPHDGPKPEWIEM